MSFRGPRLTIGLLTGLVLLLIIGGGAAMAISHPHQPVAVAPSATATRAKPTGSAVTRSGPAHGIPSTTAPRPGATSDPADATATPYGPSNNLTVQMSPTAARDARSSDVQQLLQGYFDAINQHNYAAWSQSVTGKIAASQSSSQWLAAYATTVDSSIWMQSMSSDPLQVELHFTSQQDPDLAPKDLPVDCIDWSIRYRIETENAHLVVGSTVPDSVTTKKC